MPLETATYISDLNVANPAHTDGLNQDDSHMRLVKSTLKNTFPNFTAAALASTQAQIDAAVAATSATGTLALAAGTAALPTYAFTGELNSGLYKSGTHEVSMSINGVQMAKWTTTTFDLLTYTLNLSDVAHLTVAGAAVFPLQAANIGALQVTTAALADAGVTYAKLQHVADQRLLGNFSGASAVASEYSLGSGLAVSGSVLSAPGHPPGGAYSNLVIKVLTNTTVQVTADYVTTTDGTNFRTTPVSATVNLATNGGVNALEGSLTVGASNWYRLWAITKADGTTSVLANTSDTSITTFPSGYDCKAMVGYVRTDASSQLFGTWQFGNVAQYVVGLAKTSVLPTLATATTSGAWVAASVSSAVPPKASVIRLAVYQATQATGIVAPNASYALTGGTAPYPPIVVSAGDVKTADLLLESTNVQVGVIGGGTCTPTVLGWVHNL